MLYDANQSDVTGTVNMASPGAVADAICGILVRRHGDFDEVILRAGFIDIEDIFWGRYPGLLPCDTPYHDLRHSMSTALASTNRTHAAIIHWDLIARAIAQERWSRHTSSRKQRNSADVVVVETISQRTG